MKAERRGGVFKLTVGDPRPLLEISFEGGPAEPPEEVKAYVGLSPFAEAGGRTGVVFERPLSLDEHVYGLGERAWELDRKRGFFKMWNTDVGCAGDYGWYTDPMYVSVPLFMVFDRGRTSGYFINSGAEVLVDVGLRRYDKLTAFVPEEGVELYVIRGKNMEEVLEAYSELIGRPFLLPEWGLGYQISRFTYYPQDRVVEVVRRHLEAGIRVSAVYLDIDYMDAYKMFTWSAERFPDPQRLADELHAAGVRLVTIFNPCLKVDQKYGPFREAAGLFVETKNGEIFTGPMWPGKCAWLDFMNPSAREWWAERVRRWAEDYGVDGIWLDMNEPAVLDKAGGCTIDRGAVHYAGDRAIPHSAVHNLYAYFEAMATYEGLRRAGKEPLILSRSGSAGIQKYAAVWTGDNPPEWEDLRLQTAIVLGLSVSGIPYAGMDIGAFLGKYRKSPHSSDLELLVRYYQAALFFPIFRSHRAPDTMDREAFLLPERWREKIKRVVDLRYRFLPYLSALALEAHERGRPILRPLAYYHQEDETAHVIYDEYYVGPYLLYAPLLNREEKREVYLPRGRWADFWRGEELEGPAWVENSDGLPIYVRWGAVVPLAGEAGAVDFLVYGEGGRIKLRDGTVAAEEGGTLRFSSPLKVGRIVVVGRGEIAVNGPAVEVGLLR